MTTTAKHPFYVVGKGWTWAGELQPGDRILGHDGTSTAVESIAQTDRHESLYNLRVAFDQTYFVGSHSWGCSLWVHNDYVVQPVDGGYQIFNTLTNQPVSEVFADAAKATEKLAELRSALAAAQAAANAARVNAPNEIGSRSEFTMWASPDKAKGIYGALNNDGLAEFAIEAGPQASPRGRVLFAQMMEHFGSEAKGIVGSWSYGENLRRFNQLVAQGMAPAKAAAQTWTGTQAARFGFTAVKIVTTEGASGAYTKVIVEFLRP